jgi:hypothetical protein
VNAPSLSRLSLAAGVVAATGFFALLLTLGSPPVAAQESSAEAIQGWIGQLGAEQFADLAIARGIASRAQVNDEGVVDLELAHGTDPESAMRAVLEISPMRSMALRRMNLDDLFVELVGASDARLNDIQTPSAHSRVNHSSAHSSVHRTKGARVDA